MLGGGDSDFERIHILSDVSLLRSYLHFKSLEGAAKLLVLIMVFFKVSPLGLDVIVDVGKDVAHNTRDQESKESTSPKKETFIAHGSLIAVVIMSCHIGYPSLRRLRRFDRGAWTLDTHKHIVLIALVMLERGGTVGALIGFPGQRVPRSRISNSNVSTPDCFAMNSPYPRLLDTMMGNMSVPPNSSAIITQPFVSVSLLPA